MRSLFLLDYQLDSSTRLRPPNNTRLSHLCGPTDEHLRTIEEALQVKIAHRQEQFKIEGPKAKAQRALDVLQALYEIAGRAISADKVQLMVAGDGRWTRTRTARSCCTPAAPT
jgi:phosphate starvation-inducible protein PhoH